MKRILVCPLNWGLGHASRDIVIIRRLIDRGHEVIIAADGQALGMLKAEFPQLEFIRFGSSVTITYFRTLPVWLKILLLSPFLGFETLREHFRLKSIVRQTGADMVISDNRYGLWHSRIPSVLITHQLNPRLPRFLKFLELPVAGIIRMMIKQFHRCWVPDLPGEDKLTGYLAHKYTLPANVIFTGPLSRFMPDPSRKPDKETGSQINNPDLLILISGPEPQRSKLENIILEKVGEIKLKTVILQGLPGELKSRKIGEHITVYSHLDSDKIKGLLENSRYIICRGGYTGIMDLVTLGKAALIIPTPGQTEQEYLASYLSNKGVLMAMEQKNLDLMEAIRQLEGFKTTQTLPENNLLDAELDRWFRLV